MVPTYCCPPAPGSSPMLESAGLTAAPWMVTFTAGAGPGGSTAAFGFPGTVIAELPPAACPVPLPGATPLPSVEAPDMAPPAALGDRAPDWAAEAFCSPSRSSGDRPSVKRRLSTEQALMHIATSSRPWIRRAWSLIGTTHITLARTRLARRRAGISHRRAASRARRCMASPEQVFTRCVEHAIQLRWAEPSERRGPGPPERHRGSPPPVAVELVHGGRARAARGASAAGIRQTVAVDIREARGLLRVVPAACVGDVFVAQAQLVAETLRLCTNGERVFHGDLLATGAPGRSLRPPRAARSLLA